jgi:hypothetical protein
MLQIIDIWGLLIAGAPVPQEWDISQWRCMLLKVIIQVCYSMHKEKKIVFFTLTDIQLVTNDRSIKTLR